MQKTYFDIVEFMQKLVLKPDMHPGIQVYFKRISSFFFSQIYNYKKQDDLPVKFAVNHY